MGSLGALANVAAGRRAAPRACSRCWLLGRLPPLAGPSWIAHPLAMHVGFAALALLSTTAVAGVVRAPRGLLGFLVRRRHAGRAAVAGMRPDHPRSGFCVLLAACAAALGSVPSACGAHEGPQRPQGAATSRRCFRASSRSRYCCRCCCSCTRRSAAPAWPYRHSLAVRGGRLSAAAAGQRDAAGRASVWPCCRRNDLRRDLHHGLLPTYSESWPQRINIEYWVDADSGNAHWWTQSASLHLPRAMGEALKFDPVPRERFPGIRSRDFSRMRPP